MGHPWTHAAYQVRARKKSTSKLQKPLPEGDSGLGRGQVGPGEPPAPSEPTEAGRVRKGITTVWLAAYRSEQG